MLKVGVVVVENAVNWGGEGPRRTRMAKVTARPV